MNYFGLFFSIHKRQNTSKNSPGAPQTARGWLLFNFFFFTHVLSVLFIPPRDAQCRVPENQKDIVARHSAFNSLHNAFSFLFCTSARVLACSAGAPRAACVRHVLCVLWWRISSWRWTGSAVWNSADPLKWLLAATRGRGDLRGTCGQMSHPLPSPSRSTKRSQHLCLVFTAGRWGSNLF